MIVDWKTDEVEDHAILSARRDLDRRQVDTYADCWETADPATRREAHPVPHFDQAQRGMVDIAS